MLGVNCHCCCKVYTSLTNNFQGYSKKMAQFYSQVLQRHPSRTHTLGHVLAMCYMVGIAQFPCSIGTKHCVVDQPVGTGFSRGDQPATDNAADTAAYVQWLDNFFGEFPALRSKKIHLMGESYAGVFVSTPLS